MVILNSNLDNAGVDVQLGQSFKEARVDILLFNVQFNSTSC
jgi:hypothetical protein